MHVHKKEGTPQIVLHTDASGNWGCGPFRENDGSNTNGSLPSYKKSIALNELLPIVLACMLWGLLWAHKHVEVQCDNAAVVDILRTKTRKCKEIMHLLQCLHF